MRTLILALAFGVAGCAHSSLPDVRPDDFSVEYRWGTGSLPPQYHHTARVELGADGTGTLVAETAYGQGPSKTWSYTLDDAAHDALYLRLREEGLFDSWGSDDNPPVGGSSWWADAQAHGKRASIPSFVPRGQSDAKEALHDVIRAAAPDEIWALRDLWLSEAQKQLDEAGG